ncbi:DUF2572 family protein [Pasteurellaceae bacterium TAE3-ERU1]|nr:DUF2572 family protein [Pasteurellaceae bacterium TAE3-ERU1]
MNVRKGTVALGMIAVIGTLLSAVLLFQALQLGQRRAHLAQQQGYFELDYQLKRQAKRDARECASAHEARKPHFALERSQHNAYGHITHRQVCHFLPYLSQEMLTDGVLTNLIELVPARHWAELATRFHSQRLQTRGIWWLKAGSRWQLDEAIEGVVFAEKNSVIAGHGQVRGVVIADGAIAVDVEVTYDVDAALAQIHKHGFWQIEPGSWHDFSAL